MMTFRRGYHTETAGTVITEVIPGVAGRITRITNISYLCGTNAHVLTIMRPVAHTLALADAAASQAELQFTKVDGMKNSSNAPEAVAASDYVVYETSTGGFEINTVASLSAKVVTMNTNLAVAVSKGAKIWIFGEVARASHQKHTCTVSVLNDLIDQNFSSGIPKSTDPYNFRSGEGDPLIFHSANPAAAGFLKSVSGVYAPSSERTAT